MTASVTGAGLVIAFYALLANMSDRIFERRIQRLEEKRQEFKNTVQDTQNLNISNLESTRAHARRLTSLTDEIEERGSFPSFLGPLVGFDFILFIITAFLAFYWLGIYEVDRTVPLGNLVIFVFIGSLASLGISGVFGITEVYQTIRYRFEELKKQKEHAKEEIREAVKGPVQHPT
jgi:ABC-type multidrug transport system fused ATPase/permease subunit